MLVVVAVFLLLDKSGDSYYHMVLQSILHSTLLLHLLLESWFTLKTCEERLSIHPFLFILTPGSVQYVHTFVHSRGCHWPNRQIQASWETANVCYFEQYDHDGLPFGNLDYCIHATRRWCRSWRVLRTIPFVELGSRFSLFAFNSWWLCHLCHHALSRQIPLSMLRRRFCFFYHTILLLLGFHPEGWHC